MKKSPNNEQFAFTFQNLERYKKKLVHIKEIEDKEILTDSFSKVFNLKNSRAPVDEKMFKQAMSRKSKYSSVKLLQQFKSQKEISVIKENLTKSSLLAKEIEITDCSKLKFNFDRIKDESTSSDFLPVK